MVLCAQVMPLDGEDRLQAAKDALEALQTALQDGGQHGPLTLKIAGLSEFRRQVRVPLSWCSLNVAQCRGSPFLSQEREYNSELLLSRGTGAERIILPFAGR